MPLGIERGGVGKGKGQLVRTRPSRRTALFLLAGPAFLLGVAIGGCGTSKRQDFLAIRSAQLPPIPGDRSAFIPSTLFPTLAGFSETPVAFTAAPHH